MQILTNINLSGNEIQNVRLQSLASGSGVTLPGSIFYNSVSGRASLRNSTAIVEFATIADLNALSYGDMFKSVYDTTNNGIVDAAESAPWEGITGKPSTFTPSAHTHPTSEITGLDAALAGKLSTTGNAASATKLATARTIALAGDVTGSVTFDGTANISITTAVADDSHNHIISNVDGLQTALDGKAAASHTHATADVTGLDTALAGKLDVGANAVSASTAAKLTTPRAIALSGGVTGTANFDGSAGVTIAATVVPSGHQHTTAQVTGLDTALAGKAATVHTHTASQITDFTTAVNTAVAAYWDQIAGTDGDVDTIREVLDLVIASAAGVSTAIKRFQQTIGDGTATSFALNHNLNTRDVVVEVYDSVTYDTYIVDVKRTTVNQVTINVNPAPATGSLRVVILA